jgi:hypothetical protein
VEDDHTGRNLVSLGIGSTSGRNLSGRSRVAF